MERCKQVMGMSTLCSLVAIVLWGQATLLADNTYEKLQSGPMIGHASMAEVLIWVQTTEAAEVQVYYWDVEDTEQRFKTAPVTTEKHTAFVAKCLADEVKSDSSYGYEVWIDGEKVTPRYREGFRDGVPIPLTFSTPKNWRFREEGHRIFDFTVGFGSCAYINQEGGYDRLSNANPYGAGYEIFESIHEVNPDIFVWLGDNIYLREPDWTSWTGILHRWTHDRSIPHLRGMLATRPNYAIWDDHDYGPNDAGWDFWNKAQTTRAFNLFYGNPSAGLPTLPGIFTFFNRGDVNFYLLDNRFHRDGQEHLKAFDREKDLLGKRQVDWLISSLKYRQKQAVGGYAPSYPSNFNVICIGNTVLGETGSVDSYLLFDEEWQYLMDRIMEEEIDGVVFVSGDVHFGEVNLREMVGGGQPGVPGKAGQAGETYRMMEVTTSPLTAGPWSGPDSNAFRYDIFPGEKDTTGGVRNFATLSFEGPLDDRTMTIRYYDTNGTLLNQKEGAASGVTTDASVISANWLKAPERRQDD